MIFITVGTQLPFDRLIKHVNEWNMQNANDIDIIAQVGNSDYKPSNMVVHKNIEPTLFEKNIIECDVLISHAGMGSILTALRMNKPIIIFPRRASLKEHRNDHQLATSKSFSDVEGIYVAYSENELFELLNRIDELKSGALNESSEYKRLKTNLAKIIG
jgi:UDP-N-acetylglucosamine transferase subunit ALG13